jgi:hypothetical protein
MVVDAIQHKRFHILSHPAKSIAAVQARQRWLADGIAPAF